MRIKILLFAHLREVLGKTDFVLEASEGESVGSVVGQLAVQHGLPELNDPSLFFAVNEAYTEKNKILKDVDTLACLAPMSGGAA